MEDILIIKTGYSEVLDNSQDSLTPSFGDILRITPILHSYKNDNVTWITDKEAFPLLEENPYIKRLLPLNFTTAMHLLNEEFDTVINLEKNPDICQFSDRISAWKKYGFRLDKKTGAPEAYDRASEILTVSSDLNIKKDNKKTVQELLFEMIGKKWCGEEYILGYKPKSREIYDIGLNMLAGKKWPIKLWPEKYWDELEDMLIQQGYKVTRQDKQGEEVIKNLYGYVDWLNSSRMIVSNDSLGLHIALALKKKVIGLFGPTAYKEIEFYGRGKAVFPELFFECMPCLGTDVCIKGDRCIEFIYPEKVFNEIKLLLNKI